MWIFLSAAIGQRPRNFLSFSCCCCSCSSPFGSFPHINEVQYKKILPDAGIEPLTTGFSVHHSTNRAIYIINVKIDFYISPQTLNQYWSTLVLLWLIKLLLLQAARRLSIHFYKKNDKFLIRISSLYLVLIPAEAEIKLFRINNDWLWNNFPPERRYSSMIFVDEENVLRPEVIRAIYRVHKSVDQFVGGLGDTWQDMCTQVELCKEPHIGRLVANTMTRFLLVFNRYCRILHFLLVIHE